MADAYRANGEPVTRTTKVFRSGNSVAVRLPKALGVKEGVEMTVREEQGRYILEPVQRTRRKIDLAGIAGACPWLKPLTTEEREFDHSPRAWDEPDWPGFPEAKE